MPFWKKKKDEDSGSDWKDYTYCIHKWKTLGEKHGHKKQKCERCGETRIIDYGHPGAWEE